MKARSFHLAQSISAFILLAGATHIWASGEVPARPPFDRYTLMMNKSPFAVATANALAAPTPSFAKDLYVANAARTQDGDLVTVQSATDRNLKEYLSTKGPNEHGYAISDIEWSEKPAQTKVTISKDGQFATIGFNQALMTQAPPSPQQPGGANPPGPIPVPPPTYIPPPAYVPARPASTGIPKPPAPHTRGLIQRNPSTSVQKLDPNGLAER